MPASINGQEVKPFDGFWESTAADGSATTVIISGQKVWHDGDLFAELKLLDPAVCVLVTQSEDTRGEISEDWQRIMWSDGDCWVRSCQGHQHAALQAEAHRSTGMSGPLTSVEGDAHAIASVHVPAKSCPGPPKKDGNPADAVKALFDRDAKRFRDSLDDGVPVDSEVDARQLWQAMRWQPTWTNASLPQTPLLVAALLLQWPEGVELCVQHGADVNMTYAGPYRTAEGGVACEPAGAPVLRVALSARGPAQSAVCRQLLNGRIRARTLHTVRRKAKKELEADTEYLLNNWSGPVLEDAAS